MKKIFSLVLVALFLTLGITTYAAGRNNINLKGPHNQNAMEQVISELTGMSVDDVIKAKQSGKTYLQIANEKGISEEKLYEAVKAKRIKLIDQEVKDGKLTKEQGEALKTKINNHKGRMPGDFRGKDNQRMAEIIAKLTGMSVDDVIKARQGGKTYQQIANEKGVSEEKIKNAMYEEKVKVIDQRVKDGKLTKEQGEALKKQIKDRIDNCKNRIPDDLKKGRGHGMKKGFGNGQKFNGCN